MSAKKNQSSHPGKVSFFLALTILATLIIGAPSCMRKRQQTFSLAYMEIWADELKVALMDISRQWAKDNNVVLVPEKGMEWKLSEADIKAADLVSGHNVPDIAMFPNHLAVVYKNELRDFSPVMAEISSQYPGVQEISREMLFDKGRWVGVPVFSWSHVMVLRKDLLKSIEEEAPQTWTDLARVATKMNDGPTGNIGFGLGLGKDDDFAMFFQSLLWSYGGSIFDKTGKEVIFDKIPTRLAVEYIMKLQRAGVFPKGALQWDGADNNKAFLGGRTGLTFNSPTIYYYAVRKDPDLAKNILHVLYPKNDKGERHAYATGFSFVSRSDNKNKPLVDSFLRFLFKPENYKKLIAAGGGSVNPAFKGLETMKLWSDPNLQVALESMKYEHAVGWPGPVTKASADVFRQRCITKMFARIIDDHESIDAAIQETTAEIQEVISSNKGD
jgi:ABC-type glycerol-3-phosphate transport system substrate-binding protein